MSCKYLICSALLPLNMKQRTQYMAGAPNYVYLVDDRWSVLKNHWIFLLELVSYDKWVSSVLSKFSFP